MFFAVWTGSNTVTPKYKYKAFISYSHEDEKWARWLHSALEGYRAPKNLVGNHTSVGPIPARLIPIFRDRDELPSAPDLTGRIKEALRDSENLIVICSPRAAKSRYVDQEIESFKRLGRSGRIFSIIVDGDPNAEDPEANCFPSSLRARYDANGDPLPGDEEPIAADARKQGDGRSLARLKVVAGMIGVGLDDLRQRELQRKQRRMAAITFTSLAALAVSAMLAISAIIARNDANQRREQAEDLLSFMVVDLRESLTPIGRLDLLEKVGEKAMAYFATVKTADLTDGELLRHAQVMTQVGEIRMSQRQYDNALSSFTEAYDRSAELARNNPTDGDHLFGRGQAEFWVGYVHWRRGDFDNAREWLTQYRDSSQRLSDLDRSRDDWAREVAYGDHNLAVLAWESGDLDAADAGFNRELEALFEMQERDASSNLKRDVADAVSWLGNVAVRKGALSDARRYFERSSAYLKSLYLEESDNAVRQYDWAYSVQRIVGVAAITGDLDGAGDLVDEAMSMFDELAAQDEQNREWMRANSKSWIAKGNLLAASGNLESARTYAIKAATVLEALTNEEASDITAREQLADAYHLMSWIERSTGNIAAALDSNQKALRNMQLLQKAGRLNDSALGKLASVTVLEGLLQADSQQLEQARRAWEQAEGLLSDRAGTAHSPSILDPWARILMLSGRNAEAEIILQELSVGGYRPLQPWPEVAH